MEKYIRRKDVCELLSISKHELYKLVEMKVIIPASRTAKQKHMRFFKSTVQEQYNNYINGGDDLLYLGEIAFLGEHEINKHLEIFNLIVPYKISRKMVVVNADDNCCDLSDYYHNFKHSLKYVSNSTIYIFNGNCGPFGHWEDFMKQVIEHNYNLIVLQDYRRK